MDLSALLFGALLTSGPTPLSPFGCQENLLQAFPSFEILGSACDSYEMYDRQFDRTETEVSCFLKNSLTIYLFQRGDQAYAQVKGINGRNFQGLSLSEDQTIPLPQHTCGDVVGWIEELASATLIAEQPPARREFLSHESVALVASERTCTSVLDLIQDYQSLLSSEGRSSVQILCVPESVGRTQNPSLVRRWIRSQIATEASGIILLGNDLPPFEYYLSTNWELPFSPYKYGATDLPYGDNDHGFWSKPLSKQSSKLKNKIYFEQDFLYPTKTPTSWAFDLDVFIARERISRSYIQKRWVSRWMGRSENLREDLQRFIKRRSTYRPHQFHHLVYAQGGTNIMFQEGMHDFWNYHHEDLKDLNLPAGSTQQVLLEVDLARYLYNLNRNITILDLSEHGHPEGMGNITSSTFESISHLPEILSWDTCLGGSWMYSEPPFDRSLITRSFSVAEPPLVMLATQAIKSFKVMGSRDLFAPEIFFNQIQQGKSLGQRQIEVVNGNLDFWKSNPDLFKFWHTDDREIPHQIMSVHGLFGDGTIEF